MATVKRPKGEIILNRSEQALLTGGLNEWSLGEAGRRRGELKLRSKNMRQLRSGLMAPASGQSQKIASIRKPKTLKDLTAAAQLGKPGRRGKATSRNAVFGLNSGTDVPPYDFNWQPPSIVQPQSAGPYLFQSGADETTGYLWASAGCARTDGLTQMDCYAGLGFWYVPDRPGILNLFATPQIHYRTEAGAASDYGNADLWLYMGVQPYVPDPFGPLNFQAIVSQHLDSIDIGWYDSQTHDKLLPNHFINTALFVRPDLIYACWIWIAADTARDQEGYGEAFIEAAVEGINFVLF